MLLAKIWIWITTSNQKIFLDLSINMTKIRYKQCNFFRQSKTGLKQSEEIKDVILWLNLDLSSSSSSSYYYEKAVINLLQRKLYKRSNDEERYENSDFEPFAWNVDEIMRAAILCVFSHIILSCVLDKLCNCLPRQITLSQIVFSCKIMWGAGIVIVGWNKRGN